MTIDTNELRRLAQAATPGPWYVTGKLTRYVEARIDGGLIQEVAACGPTKADGGYGPQQEANARLLAAANPATISELLDRLEAAEKERDALHIENEALRAEVIRIKEVEFPRKAQAVADGWRGKCERLKAKIAEMEKQKPVAWAATDETKTVVEALGMNQSRRFDSPLFLAAGAQAQPAPSVPTSLLVAIADLATQMGIVSRVGFIDAPNDKDSCAAFCVAEGTWLELMSCVESLAASLAAAPESKP